MLNMGVAYTLSKRTKLFALYSDMRNGESANFSNEDTAPAPAPAVGQDLRQLATGLAVSF
jgi:predicted porin